MTRRGLITATSRHELDSKDSAPASSACLEFFLAMCKERPGAGAGLGHVLVVWIKAQSKLVYICVCVPGGCLIPQGCHGAGA